LSSDYELPGGKLMSLLMDAMTVLNYEDKMERVFKVEKAIDLI
jgi:hypothetical protein